MPSHGYQPDDAIAAALDVLHCSPDEIAEALGIDLATLWGYCGGERSVPDPVLRRLAALLEERAVLLYHLAGLLGTGPVGRKLPIIS